MPTQISFPEWAKQNAVWLEEQRAKCQNCNAKGRVRCKECYGKGTDSDGEDCRECDGNGKHACLKCDPKNLYWDIRLKEQRLFQSPNHPITQ